MFEMTELQYRGVPPAPRILACPPLVSLSECYLHSFCVTVTTPIDPCRINALHQVCSVHRIPVHQVCSIRRIDMRQFYFTRRLALSQFVELVLRQFYSSRQLTLHQFYFVLPVTLHQSYCVHWLALAFACLFFNVSYHPASCPTSSHLHCPWNHPLAPTSGAPICTVNSDPPCRLPSFHHPCLCLVRPCPCPSLAQTTGRIPDSVKLNVLIRSQESEALRRHLQLNG